MMKVMMKRCVLCVSVAVIALSTRVWAEEGTIHKGNVGGHLAGPWVPGPETYDAGYSMYAAAWPLLREYPGQSFQSGLFGTWMHPHRDKPAPEGLRLYSDIEGGLGWWRDTEYATETPKFIMGGVALNFVAWANGPGAGKGRSWAEPKGKYGITQLSPWLVWPPDGLNLKQGTCGQLFGSGYLPLPLTKAKTTTAGTNVPTGNQCWTLFLNTGNFKGPVAFFTPYFWSRPSVDDPRLSGMFFDSRPSENRRIFSMETQHIQCSQATDSKGRTYARIAQTQFPVGADGNSVVLHRITSYSKKALWDGVEAWLNGGDPVDGIDPQGTYVNKLTERRASGFSIRMPHVPKEEYAPIAIDSFVRSVVTDPLTYGFRLDSKLATRTDTAAGALAILPEYYQLVKDEKDSKCKWVAVAPEDVPAETGLAKVSFASAGRKPPEPYVTPDDAKSCWKKPGPVAGPFEARPGDGSVVTYYWYRFADQPALLNADLSDQEREDLQKRVEKLHRHWTKDREYLAPPTVGKLADIDPALIVTPPKGLEVGYVPIVTRQELQRISGSKK